MAQIVVENLEPNVLDKLEALAKQNGRSLQEELKHILKQAAESAVYHTGGDIAKAREAVARSQARYATQTFSDSTELIREDRDR